MKNIKKPFLWIGLLSLLLVACFALIIANWKNEPTFSLPPLPPSSSIPRPPTFLPPLPFFKNKQETEQRKPGKRMSDKDLGISFILPADFELHKNKASIGFDYLTILYPNIKGDEFEERVEKEMLCDFYCAVIRPTASLFPGLLINSNEDIKTHINEVKRNIPSKEASVVKEWEQSGAKFLQFYINGKPNQIISIESKSPSNFVSFIFRENWDFWQEKDELAKSIEIIGQSKYVRPQSEFLTYTNKRLGIQFDYPSKWGAISYDPCHDETKPLTAGDYCNYITLSFVDLDNAIFLSSHSVFASQYPPEREWYWGDDAGSIKGESNVSGLCNHHNTAQCEVYKNSSGVLVARIKQDTCLYDECRNDVIMYYIKSKNPEFLGIILSTDRLKYSWGDLRYPQIENLETKMDRVVNSLKFL